MTHTNDPERNKETVRRFVDRCTNNLDDSDIESMRDPSYRVSRVGFRNLHDLSGREIVEPGNTDPIGGFRALHTAFTGWNAQIDDLGAEGEYVWTRMTVTGRHEGEFLGIPATGREIRVSEIGIRRFRDGRMVEGWWMGDEIALLRQLGIDIRAGIDAWR